MATDTNPSGRSALLFIHALTSLHPGTGTALGHVDLPVQRERHTGWPLIPASSLKGILRGKCRGQNSDEERKQWLAVFGPETSSAAAHAGALSLTDARILAFPVRSLKGVFAWVSCPGALERLARDLSLLGEAFAPPGFPVNFPRPAPNQAAFGESLAVEKDAIVLEEYDFNLAGEDGLREVAGWVAEHGLADEPTRKRFQSHLAVLHDDDFSYFVRHATEVTARIGLNYDTKTVKEGALFYEEFLPPETLFYAVVLAEASRSDKQRMNAAQVLDYVRGKMPDVLQIGGNETTGKGLCAVRLSNGKEG
jgi:CRISPR-associated protein Cmr4